MTVGRALDVCPSRVLIFHAARLFCRVNSEGKYAFVRVD